MPKRGDIVAARFLDHVEGDDEPMECVVFGRVRRVTGQSITVASWDYAKQSDAPLDNNQTVFCLVRRAVLKVEILTPAS